MLDHIYVYRNNIEIIQAFNLLLSQIAAWDLTLFIFLAFKLPAVVSYAKKKTFSSLWLINSSCLDKSNQHSTECYSFFSFNIFTLAELLAYVFTNNTYALLAYVVK